MNKKPICFFLILCVFAFNDLKGSNLRTLLNSLDPDSLSQSLSFYELYHETAEGQEALRRICKLLGREQRDFLIPRQAFSGLITLVNRPPSSTLHLGEDELQFIERLAAHLPNRKLKGFSAKSEEEVLALAPHEIDIGKALLLAQLAGSEDLGQGALYEAMLDFMALQVLTKVSLDASPQEKIRAMNQFVFEEMRFRFPPHSLYAQDIDVYTFLPSVLDNHLGVCLGVTTLYLALAQRVDLPLEIITPPGHIFIRYREGDKIINIETTARGIDVPTEHYLGVNTSSLKLRNLKEVVGMTFINQASIYLYAERYGDAVKAYERAFPYLDEDPLAQELLGYSYLFVGREEEGKHLLQKAAQIIPEGALVKNPMIADLLESKVDLDGIKTAFLHVDEKRETIVKKLEALQKTLERKPEFRSGLQQIAVAYLQLHRSREALEALQRYHAIDPNDPVIEYYLAVLYGERRDFPSSWKHLKSAEAITKGQDFYPRALRELRKELVAQCPE